MIENLRKQIRLFHIVCVTRATSFELFFGAREKSNYRLGVIFLLAQGDPIATADLCLRNFPHLLQRITYQAI